MINDVSANEASGKLTFTVSLDRALDIDIDVTVSYADVTTSSGEGEATAGVGGEDPGVTDGVEPRWGHQRAQPHDEVPWAEALHGRAVAEDALHVIDDGTVLVALELGFRATRSITADGPAWADPSSSSAS